VRQVGEKLKEMRAASPDEAKPAKGAKPAGR
jgi:hypothetical protein